MTHPSGTNATPTTAAGIVRFRPSDQYAQLSVMVKPKDLPWGQAFRQGAVHTKAKGAMLGYEVSYDDAYLSDLIWSVNQIWSTDLCLVVLE